MKLWGLESLDEKISTAISRGHYFQLTSLQNSYHGMTELNESKPRERSPNPETSPAARIEPDSLSIDEILFADTYLSIDLDQLELLPSMQVQALKVWRDPEGRIWSADSLSLVALAFQGAEQTLPVQWIEPPQSWLGLWGGSGRTIQVQLKDHDLVMLVANSSSWSPDQTDGVIDGNAIIPNEFKHHLITESLRHIESGVLLSVGSFRVYHTLTEGQFDQTFVVDIDQVIKAFGILNKQLILQSRSRNDYLARLLAGRPASADELALSFDELIKKFKEINRLGLLNRHKRMGIEMSPSLWAALTEINYSSLISALIDGTQHPYNSASCFESYDFNGGLDSTIFYSDESFEEVQQVLDNDKLRYVTQSIVSPELLEDLSQYLQRRHQHIAVIDFSNALWHV
ncbi:MAG: hypothetical protein AAF202_11175, partial [Pseudomonadota bacterium]